MLRRIVEFWVLAFLRASAALAQVVNFADPSLETAIRDALNIPTDPILENDMLGLTTLTAQNLGIQSLAGLEAATNIIELDLQGNALVDITPLANLTNLGRLVLSNNNIADITPISSLANLTQLELKHNAINDLTPLSGMTNLVYLLLDENNILDVTPLSGLVDLLGLALRNNAISDLTFLEAYTQIIVLDLTENEISDITPLAGLTTLRDLYIGDNNIVDVTPLSGLLDLVWLDLPGNAITDVTALAGLVNLTILKLPNNAITDVTPLAGLTSLEQLHLAENNIVDLTPLAGLVNLTVLNLGYNAITDITPLMNLTDIDFLALEQNAIADITTLASLTKLWFLDLAGNNIVDVTPLTSHMDLTILNLAENAIQDVTALANLVNLNFLALYDNHIVDVTALSGLGNLKSLNLSLIGISDLSPLSGMVELTELYLHGNEISDLTPLAGLTNLETLFLSDNNIGNLSPLNNLVGLNTLSLRKNVVSDVAPLASLVNLDDLDLSFNNIRETGALLANPGLGAGDTLWLELNPLSPRALCEDIPILETRGFNQFDYSGSCTSMPVTIPDAALEAAIRAALSVPSGNIYLSELQSLTTLDASGFGIADLTGLESATDIIILDLSNNNITTVTPLLANPEFADGDAVNLSGNPLSQSTLCNEIPSLESRGVLVEYDGSCEPPALTVSPLSAVVDATAGSTEFAIANSGGGTLGTWTAQITKGAEWLSVTPPSGSGPATLIANFTANPSQTNRTGTITITAPNADNSPVSIAITQKGDVPSILPTVIVGTPSVSITNTGPIEFAVAYFDALAVLLTADDVDVIATGNVSATVFVQDGTTANPTVIVSNVQGDGTLAIQIKPGTAQNASGSDTGSDLSEAATVDNTPPTISIGAPSATTTTTGPVTFPVTYTGASTVALTSDHVIPIFGGTATGTVSVENGVTSTPTIRIANISGDGTVAIQIAADTAVDEAGNAAPAAGPSAVVTIESDSDVVTFEDPRLEQAVRETLGIPSNPILKQDLLALTQLYAAGRGIESLTGLEHASSLERINLSYNQLVQIDALVANQDFAAGAELELYGNPLAQDSICSELPTSADRSVAVGFNGQCGPAAQGRIMGWVDEAESPGTPVGCAAVLVMENGLTVGVALVDSSGYYEVDALLQGSTYTLHFASPGRVTEVLTHTLATGEDEVSVALAAGDAPALTGFVVDDSGEHLPVPGALVIAYQQGQEVGRTVTCASGAFDFQQLDLLKAAPITLEVAAPALVSTIVEADADTPNPIEIELPGLVFPGSIAGNIVDHNLTPAPGAEVIIQALPAGYTQVRTTSQDGTYSIANVPPGSYAVRAVLLGVGTGFNSGNVNDDPATIDVELLEDNTGSCTPPSAPTGVTATDGTDTNAVIVTWTPLLGDNLEYQVLRSTDANVANASPVSDWITSTTFTDTTAAAPTPAASLGCNPVGGTTFHTYHYFVIAREAGTDCESEPSTSDTGYQGKVETLQQANTIPTGDWTALALCAIILWSLTTLAATRTDTQ